MKYMNQSINQLINLMSSNTDSALLTCCIDTILSPTTYCIRTLRLREFYARLDKEIVSQGVRVGAVLTCLR